MALASQPEPNCLAGDSGTRGSNWGGELCRDITRAAPKQPSAGHMALMAAPTAGEPLHVTGGPRRQGVVGRGCPRTFTPRAPPGQFRALVSIPCVSQTDCTVHSPC